MISRSMHWSDFQAGMLLSSKETFHSRKGGYFERTNAGGLIELKLAAPNLLPY